MSVSGSSSSSPITITGTLGGVQISDLISVQDSVNRAPAVTIQKQETSINNQNAALTSIQTSLNTLYSSLGSISDPTFFEKKIATVGNTSVGSATVDSTVANNGTYSINVSQVATDSVYVGSKATAIPAASATVDTVFGSTALGTLTVGTASGSAASTSQITITSGETLQQVADAINTALGGTSEGQYASYNATTGKFTISAGSPLILSSGTSDFLQQAQLFNNFSAVSSTSVNFGTTGSEPTMSSLFSGFQAGTFSLNGVSINVASTDTIDDVISKINAQVPDVTAENLNGRLVVNSTDPVTIANGTGSFFNQAGLATSSATTTTSANAVGTLNTSAEFGTAGSITINGVTVNYAATDTLATLLTNINASSAGVTAVYDSYHDRIGFVEDNAGPNSISISNVTGPLSGYGLVDGSGNETGTFTAGLSTTFSVNGGAAQTVGGTTIDSSALGIPGVSFTAAGTGNTTITISPDVATIQAGINAFVTQYNASQNIIAAYTSLSLTDPTQDGILANDPTVSELSQSLRLIFGSDFYSSGTYQTLADFGIDGNDNDNTATLSSTTDLTNALTNNLTDVLNVFANPANGLYTKLSDILVSEAAGGDSILGNEIATNNQQLTQMNSQIAQIEANADDEKTQLETEYAAYESSYQTAQSDSSYLSNNSSSSSSSSSSGLG